MTNEEKLKEVAELLYERVVGDELSNAGVVRCGECKYQHKEYDGFCWCNKAVIDMSDDEMSCVIANDNDYCSHGERKEKNDE